MISGYQISIPIFIIQFFILDHTELVHIYKSVT